MKRAGRVVPLLLTSVAAALLGPLAGAAGAQGAESSTGAGAGSDPGVQGGAATAPQGGDPGNSGASQGGAAGGAVTPSTGLFPYGFAPPAAGQPVGGGNATESSSRPVQGDREDSFDLAHSAGGSGGSTHGDANGPIFLEPRAGRGRTRGATGSPDGDLEGPSIADGTYTVKRGDTLWGICDTYFQNPYAWPKIWSYNPQIQNPHWIFPNDVLRLRQGPSALNGGAKPATGGAAGGAQARLIGRGTKLTPGTVMLRDEGFVDDQANLDWGSIAGSPADKMFLSDYDEAYFEIDPQHDVQLGQELAIFRPVRKVRNGQVITLQGTAKVDAWDPKTRIARAQITETLDAIERGARVGPVPRKFEIVPPVAGDVNVRVHVLVAVHPHEFYGQNQIVFIDAGSDEGLHPGNRLFVVRRGDAWRGTMGTDRTADRVPIENNTIGEVERTPHLDDESRYPEEVVGEIRVLNTQKRSATCYVTETRKEIEINDEAVSRKGY